MKITYTFRTAVKALIAHKSRSLLTILGLVIGIFAIITVMAMGEGAEGLILNQIQSFGSNIISVEPGRTPSGLTDIYEIFTDSLKERELKAIENPANVQGVVRTAPFVGGVFNLTYEKEVMRTNVWGSTEFWLDLIDVSPNQGRMFSDEEAEQFTSVAVIGSEVKEELFGDAEALGEKIKIKDRLFKVIGILPPTGQVLMMNIDSTVTVPYTTAQRYLLGIDHYHAIMVELESEEILPYVVEDITATLRDLHNIDDPEKDDFRIETREQAVDIVGTVTSTLTFLLVSVAAIALLVGGIGIMNIMLVSVTERTKEIGLRKALGATKEDILTQFLIESMLLTIIGGIIGILAGAGVSWLISYVMRTYVGADWDFIFPISAVLIGVGVSASIGLIFGIYPAKQAADKSPIEALRYE